MVNEDQLDLMITGALVKDYQQLSNAVESIAMCVDKIIELEDHEDILSSVSSIYIHLQSLKFDYEAILNDVNDYLDSVKSVKEESSDDSI